MAGYRALGVLLAAVALLAAAARAAADDEHMIHWKCFKSCTTNCHDKDALDDVAMDGGAPGYGPLNASGPGGVSRRCKTGCLHECFEDLPVLCYQQCVVSTCLCLPPYSKEKMACMKKCCDKCFHHGPAPKPPTPKPGPGPMPPTPRPPPPKPKPSPPKAPPPPKKPCPPHPRDRERQCQLIPWMDPPPPAKE